MAVTISLCMIVKNEEKTLARCLNSVKGIADEIIVVDTGSADGTKRAAAAFTGKIFDFAWCDDFSAARNFSFEKAGGDYLMWLDADDVIEGENRTRFIKLKERLETERPDVVMCRYNVGFDENGAPDFTYFRERLFKREDNFRWQGFVHECIVPAGKIVYSESAVSHRKQKESGRRNLELYQKVIFKRQLTSPREKYYYGRELFYNKLYIESISVLEDALKDTLLWKTDAIGACQIISDCNLALKKYDAALTAALNSFSYGLPRAEILCRIGDLFKLKNDFGTAAYWYARALDAPDVSREGGFSNESYRTFVPLLELSVCCYNLKDLTRAKEYHERAKALRPTHPAVLYNDKFFSRNPCPNAKNML